MATNLNKKIIAVCCLVSIISASFLPIFAKKAEAQWVVFDPGNFVPNTLTAVSTTISAAANIVTAINTTLESPVKEFGLDTIAWMLVNIIIERIAASTINWINSGFKGSPAFVTNPEKYFKNIADQTAGQLIFNHPDLRFMCAPLRARVQIALTNSYRQPYNYQCTLGAIERNFDGFMNDFNQGGWDGFIQVSQNSQNNPLGLYNQMQNQMNVSIGSALGQKHEELSWGKGFMSFRTCGKWASTPGIEGGGSSEEDTTVNDEGGNPNNDYEGGKTPDQIPSNCESYNISTPGSVIEGKLLDVLGSGMGRLEVADEINEIISALLNQLAGRIIGGVGKGLRALSGKDNNGSNVSYFEQLKNASLTDTKPMPSNGKCPDYYVAISAEECGTNDLIRQSFIEARDADAKARAAIDEGRRQGQNMPPPPPLPPCTGSPLCPTPPPPLICPADGSISLSSSSITISQSATIYVTEGWTGGTFIIADLNVARISPYSNFVIFGVAPGTTSVFGAGFRAPNGATNCSLNPATITVL